MKVHNSQSNIKIMIFILICCEYKTANSTGLEQLPLEVLDDPLAHGCCHPVFESEKPMVNKAQHTWIVFEVVEISGTTPLLPEHKPSDPPERGH